MLAKRAVPILLCLLAVPAFAASPRWTLLGPDGGQATLVAVAPSNPNVVYATGPDLNGIFRSQDGGRTWSWPEAGALAPLVDLLPWVIVADPRRPGTVYLGSAGFGLTRSTDGGATWSAFQTFGLARADVEAVVFDPGRPNVLYAALDDPAGGVFRSRDGGATWSRRPAGLPSPTLVQTLAIDPRRPNVLLAVLRTAGTGRRVYRSTDSGETWKATAFPAGLSPSVLAFSGGRSGLAYALVPLYGLYKSPDGGVSWSRVTGLPAVSSSYTAMAVDPRDPRTLLVATGGEGIFRSRDAGASWSPSGVGLTSPGVRTLTYNARGTRVYAGTNGGVYQSADGRSWARTVQGYATVGTSALALGPAPGPGGPPVLWAASPGVGIYRSLNGGGVWRRVPIPGLAPFQFADVVTDPDHPGTVWVLPVDSPSGPYRTADGGRTWEPLPAPGPFRGLVRDPASGALLLFGSRLLRSPDGGLTWTPSSAGIAAGDLILDVAFDPASPGTLYAGGEKPPASRFQPPEPRLYKSTDGGLTWTRSDDGLGVAAPVQKVTAAPSEIFAALSAALFRSTDGGAHWEQVGEGPRDPGVFVTISDLAATPDGTLYIGASTGVYRTSDGGDWTPVSDGLANLYVYDLLLDPLDPDHLYAATAAGGVAVLPLNE